jgi:hypothetical protein
MRLALLTPAALVIAFVAALSVPLPAAACSVARGPTLQEVLDGDGPIVLGRVTGAVNTDTDSSPDELTITVERVLRGRAGETVVVDQPASLCRDGISWDFDYRLIIALGVPFFDETLSPYWWEFGDEAELRGWAQIPAGVTTLDDLADLIAALPDTATAYPEQDAAISGTWVPALAGLVALLFLLVRPLRRKRQNVS